MKKMKNNTVPWIDRLILLFFGKLNKNAITNEVMEEMQYEKILMFFRVYTLIVGKYPMFEYSTWVSHKYLPFVRTHRLVILKTSIIAFFIGFILGVLL